MIWKPVGTHSVFSSPPGILLSNGCFWYPTVVMFLLWFFSVLQACKHYEGNAELVVARRLGYGDAGRDDRHVTAVWPSVPLHLTIFSHSI